MSFATSAAEHLVPGSLNEDSTLEAETLSRVPQRAGQVDAARLLIRGRLERTPYISRERVSAADCVVGQSVFWAGGYGLCRGEVIRSYVSRLSKRLSG